MFLFNRQVLVNPAHARAGTTQALEMARYVNEKTDLGVSLFQVLQGAPVGTLTFAYVTESYAASVASADSLVRSDEYMQKVEAGAQYYAGNPEDSLAKFLYQTSMPDGLPDVAGIVTAVMEVSQAAAAVAWSIEFADFMTKVTGIATSVLISNSGQYGKISWLSHAESLAQLEAAEEKKNSDPGFAECLSKMPGLFLTGATTIGLSRRIG